MKCVQGGCLILLLINMCAGNITGETLQDDNSVSSESGSKINANKHDVSADGKMYDEKESVSRKAELQQLSRIKLNQLAQTQIHRASHAFQAVGKMPSSNKQNGMELTKNISEAFKNDMTLKMARSVKSVLKFYDPKFERKRKTLREVAGSPLSFVFDSYHANRPTERIHGRGILSGDSVHLDEDDYTYYYYDDDATDGRNKGKESSERVGDAYILKQNDDKTTQAPSEYVDKVIDYVTLISSNNVFEDYLNDDFYNYLDDQPYNDENGDRSSLTEQKWQNLGTPEAVEKARRRHLTAEDSVKAHITRVHYQAECRLPKPKIVQVTDTSKRFVPHCTVLHRCEDDTGCCHSDTQTCYPKFIQKVNLHFYVIQVGADEPQIEALSFENHTECQCVERNRLRQQKSRSLKGTEVETVHTCHCPNHFDIFEEDEEDDMFSVSPNITKTCRCDCVSDNRNCEQLKRGTEAFTVEDRRCISDRRCNSPTCEYGTYNRRTGRCPKMQEKFETARRLSLDHN